MTATPSGSGLISRLVWQAASHGHEFIFQTSLELLASHSPPFKHALNTHLVGRFRRFGGTIIWWRVYHYWKITQARPTDFQSHSLSAMTCKHLTNSWHLEKITIWSKPCQRYISTLQPIQRWHSELMLLRFENVTPTPNTFPLWSRNWSSRQMSTLILTTMTSWVLFMTMFHALRNHLDFWQYQAAGTAWKVYAGIFSAEDQKKWWLLEGLSGREKSLRKLR